MRRLPVLASLLLLLPFLGVASAATTPVVEVSNATANETTFMKAFDAPAMALGDFDGDGKPEIVAHNDNQLVYVLATTQPLVLAELRTEYPAGWAARAINDPAVTDVDGDGRLDVVVVNSAAAVCVFEYAGGSSSTSMSFTRQWCRRMTTFDGSTAGADAGAWVEDVDGDGRKEVFSQTEQLGHFAYNWDGSTKWAKNGYGGNSGPLVTDLDGDGRKEVLFFGDGGEVYARDAATGTQKWQFWAGNYVRPASIPVAGAAADLDGDGRKEVVFAARDAPASDTYYYDNHMMVFVLDHNGALKARWQPSWANPLSYTHPILHDLDGDGRRDILLQDWNTIGHKPGNWEKLGPAHVAAFTATGQQLWMTTLDNSWSNDDLGLADVDGDGALEVLAIGFGSGGGDGVWSLDARTGAKESWVGVGSGWTILRGPVMGDLDGSGRLGWAISVHSSARGGAIKVFQTDAPCRATGFLGWQNNHGCKTGGATPPPPPPPPPPTGDFTATFTTNGGNEWWVAAKVQASQPLAGVDTRINGGLWKPLKLQSWGEWASSYNAPTGSTVEFRARSTSGAEAVSGKYAWPSGTPTSGGAPPPPPGSSTFDATFKNVRGNDWWVETDASVSGGTLAGVDGRVNGGAWVALTKQSYGSWAKSIHAAPGSTVEFRARAADGSADVSAAYRWPPG